MTVLSLVPMLSHATVFWDDEMESFGTGGFDALPTNNGNGHVVDTAIKFSGNGSLRYNYPALCQTSGPGQPCGGATVRLFPQTNEHFGRMYIRVSSDFQWGAPNGQTKIFGVRSTTGNSKLWFNFYFGLENIISAENTPADGSTTNIGVNMSQPREQWTCIEWHFIANTPGVPNGTLQMWKNGTQTILRNDVQWRGPTNSSAWDHIMMYRQSGSGNLWFDRVAVGSTRVGCISSTSTTSNTTRPAPPQGLVIR